MESLDEIDYKDSVAKIILWKTTEKLISAQTISMVTELRLAYPALISFLKIDLKIWNNQAVDEDLKQLIDDFTLILARIVDQNCF